LSKASIQHVARLKGDTAKGRFFAAVTRWVRAFISRRRIDEVMTSYRRVWVANEQGGMDSADQPQFSWSVGSQIEDRNFPEWAVVEQRATEWEPLASHLGKLLGGEGSSRMRCDLTRLLCPFQPAPRWNAQTNTPEIPAYDENIVNANLTRLASFIESKHIDYITKTVLVGLRVEDTALLPVRLGDNIVIDTLSDDEVQRFGEMGLIPQPFGNPQGLFDCDHPWLALQWTRSVPKMLIDGGTFDSDAVMRSSEKARSESERVHQVVLQSLALMHFGVVGLGGSATRIADWTYGATSLEAPRAEPPQFFSLNANSIVLSAADSNLLPVYFGTILKRMHDDALAIALRRLTYAMENKRPEDRLLDGMIAAEALFGAGSGELSYRISLRLAFAVAPFDRSKRRHAYEVRSSVVHGSRPAAKNLVIDGSNVSVELFVNVVEDLIREAVQAMVLKTEGKFVADPWDDIILNATEHIPSVTSSVP
jgi:hypothetical protein